jgi:protein-tyrosine kinase
MTALDQAFIKAFSQQGVSPVVLPLQPAEPTDESRPSPEPSKKKAGPLPISDVFRDVLATLEKPSAPPAGLAKKETAPEPPPQRADEPAASGPWAADSWQTSLGMPESVCFAESICIAEPFDLPQLAGNQQALSGQMDTTAGATTSAAAVAAVSPNVAPPVSAIVELPQEPSVQPTAPVTPVSAAVEPPHQQTAIGAQPTPTGDQATPVAPAPSVALEERPLAHDAFKPAWQVDRFTWPRVCRRLMEKANQEFDRLTDVLMAVNSRGQKVLAMTGCHRGEGATTLLLCAARRLAERGVRLALVDADLTRPRVAKRLGIQPQIGWNEASDAEGMPLAHAVVEATSNGLALASVRDPASTSGHTTGDWLLLAPCLETLKEHYDMVLVDLGPLENIESIGDALGRVVDGKIDAVLLVHNGRITSAERLSDVQQTLTASGIVLAGVIENFVAV